MTEAEEARTQRATAITLKSTDLDWDLVDPGNPAGPQMTALWGDPRIGPYGALLRVPAGFESPVHRHTHDERVIVISGASIHWIEGADRRGATTVRAGDFVLMPGGVNHVSAAAPGEDCLEFVTQDGPFDFVVADDPGAARLEADPREPAEPLSSAGQAIPADALTIAR